MEVMAPFAVKLLDITQSEIHDMLSLGMLIEVKREDSQKLFKELVFLSHRMSIEVPICLRLILGACSWARTHPRPET
jgi:predicted amino acid-binding ACT domain protein